MTSVAPTSAASSRRPISLVEAAFYPAADAFNDGLRSLFASLDETDFDRRTHYVDGRYENLYVDECRVQGMGAFIAFALAQARLRLGAADQRLRLGFWLNAMAPGQATSRHHHDESDELLSGVYYASAATGSGDLIFEDGLFLIHVRPQPGLMLLFPPALLHSVTPNGSDELRLSIGFNIGPAP
jgi:hypothetical protein